MCREIFRIFLPCPLKRGILFGERGRRNWTEATHTDADKLFPSNFVGGKLTD